MASSKKGKFLIDNMVEINTKFIPAEPGIFIVGGTVRDILMGKQPTDFDIAAASPCAALARRIAEKAGSRVITLGKPGLSIYRVVSGNLTFDIAPIAAGGIASDLRRRDFTVNAMAWDIYHQSLIDPLNGRADLRERRIRMVHPQNLQTDPVRLLRAFRFGAALAFFIDDETKNAIRSNSISIRQAPGERIREEWLKMLACSEAWPYIREMEETGLLTEILPELAPLKQCHQNRRHALDVFDHTMAAFSSLEGLLHHPDPVFQKNRNLAMAAVAAPNRLKLALLLHDIGKPACRRVDENGSVHFFGHESLSAEMSQSVSRRLKLSNHHRAYLDFIIRHHLAPLFLFIDHQKQKLKRKIITRFFLKSAPLTIDLLIHAIADARGKKPGQPADEFEQFCGQLMAAYFFEFQPRAKNPPLITGEDLIKEIHLTPSPLFATLLARVEEQRLTGRLRTRSQALKWVKNFLMHNKGP